MEIGVSGKMGLQSDAMASWRWISREYSYKCLTSATGKGALIVSTRAGAPQLFMKAGVGEIAWTCVYEGRTYLIVLREFCKIGSQGDIFAIVLPEDVVKVAPLTAETFLLSVVV